MRCILRKITIIVQAYQLSHWEWDTFFRELDVLIVGSGIVGLSAAIALKEQAPSLRVLVAERGPLPIGASTRNAGFACFGSLSELEDDLKQSSRKAVLSLIEDRYRGLTTLRQRYGDTAIGYEDLGGYELFRQEDVHCYQQCQDALPAWNKDLQGITGRTNTFVHTDQQSTKFSFRGVTQLILNQAEGQLDTGKLMHTLLRHAQTLGVVCLGGLEIQEIDTLPQGVSVLTAQGWTIEARQVLVATNGFAQQLLPDLAVAPARNQVLVTKPLPYLPFRGSFHYDRGYVYFRNVGKRVLLGGGRNLNPVAETTTILEQTDQIQSYLLELLQTVILPDHPAEVDRWWSGIMGDGQVKAPIVEEIMPNAVAAVRLGGMGVALGTIVGERAAGFLLGK